MGVSRTNMKRYSIYVTCTDCKMYCCLSLKCNLNISPVRSSVSFIHPLLVASWSVWVFSALLPGWWGFRRQDIRWAHLLPPLTSLQSLHHLHVRSAAEILTTSWSSCAFFFFFWFSPFSDDCLVRFSDAPLATPPNKASRSTQTAQSLNWLQYHPHPTIHLRVLGLCVGSDEVWPWPPNMQHVFSAAIKIAIFFSDFLFSYLTLDLFIEMIPVC